MRSQLLSLLVLGVDSVLDEPGDGGLVVHSEERSSGFLEGRVEEFDGGGGDGVVEEGVDDGADLEGGRTRRREEESGFVRENGGEKRGEREKTNHGLDVIHKLLEVDESELGLEVSELGKMSERETRKGTNEKNTRSQFSAPSSFQQPIDDSQPSTHLLVCEFSALKLS